MYRHAHLLLGVAAAFLTGCGGGSGGTLQPPPPAVAEQKLNDTGVGPNECFGLGSVRMVSCTSPEALALSPLQDGAVGRDAVDSTRSDADGRLGFSYRTAGSDCAVDQVTGLTWEIKRTDGGSRDIRNRYTNIDKPERFPTRPRAEVQAQIDAATNSTSYVAAVNAMALCGFTDWRLPTVNEIQGLGVYGQGKPPKCYGFSEPSAIPDDCFEDQGAEWFPGQSQFEDKKRQWFTLGSQLPMWWTSDADAATSGERVWVQGERASVRVVYWRDIALPIKLVRSARVSGEVARFRFSADGSEVIDGHTGLTWQRCVLGTQWNGMTCAGTASIVAHEPALIAAQRVAIQTGKPWRLPNIKELVSLIDYSRFEPAIDGATFPATPNAWFWSSTPRPDSFQTSGIPTSNGSTNSRVQDESGRVALAASFATGETAALARSDLSAAGFPLAPGALPPVRPFNARLVRFSD